MFYGRQFNKIQFTKIKNLSNLWTYICIAACVDIRILVMKISKFLLLGIDLRVTLVYNVT